jgi:hypothetical protein
LIDSVKAKQIAIIILAISVYVILVAYLPNVSFSQVPFLPAGRSSIDSNHTIIHGNNNNNNSRSNHPSVVKGIREEMNQQFTTIMSMIQQNPLLAHIKPEALREKTKIK